MEQNKIYLIVGLGLLGGKYAKELNKGCNAEVWARAMGWYAGALVDVLDLMPATHPDRDTLAAIPCRG